MGVLTKPSQKRTGRLRCMAVQFVRKESLLPVSRTTPLRTARFSFYGQGCPHEVELSAVHAVPLGIDATLPCPLRPA
ncbi:hypothetical protein BaRGS_00023422 [Batillaria attramentaria]|uniref:Uncharacterized protein n=1 Tax=Batillaria attramentaria TaxID=370345 RepID=A0ABD0KDY6_9CAEN